MSYFLFYRSYPQKSAPGYMKKLYKNFCIKNIATFDGEREPSIHY